MAGNPYLAPNDTTGVPTVTAATQVSAGAGDAGKLLALNSAGQVDIANMPPGIGPGIKIYPSSENLAAGDMVNLWVNTGATNVRKADASAANAGKIAHGFVLLAVTSPANATVYLLGEENTAVTGLTVGTQWLSDTTPGKTMATPPTTTGHLVQEIGFAGTATDLLTTQSGSTYIR